MSKLTKFLSIGMDLVKGQEEISNEQESYKEYKLDEICDVIQWLEEYCGHNNIFYENFKQPEKKGTVLVRTYDKSGKGIIAQIKIFPIIFGETEKTFHRINESMNMLRKITDENGFLEVHLPVGEYYVEISKGSEYEIIDTKLVILENETQNLNAEIIPIINLKESGWVSGDLHHHSIYSSPVYEGTDPVIESPKEVKLSLMAMGASFGALSDHHNTFNHKEWASLEDSEFTPILSKEISTSNGHVMSLGVDEDVIYQIPNDRERTDEHLRSEFVRITNKIKALGGLPQINHPKDHSKAISWNMKYKDILSIFQTMEIWNGSNPMIQGSTNYKAFELWCELLEEGNYIPATTGSDTHNTLANDYHEIFDKFCWLAKLIKNKTIIIPDGLKDKAMYLLKIYEQMPMIEKWAKTNLTSAGVRTFVHVEGDITEKKILESLKGGHSFLTNGPILIPKIHGKLPGDKLNENLDELDINLTLIANRPVKKLIIYKNGKRCQEIILKVLDAVNGKFDYSQVISNVDIKNVKWMFFIAADDCTNMAITNPIFLS